MDSPSVDANLSAAGSLLQRRTDAERERLGMTQSMQVPGLGQVGGWAAAGIPVALVLGGLLLGVVLRRTMMARFAQIAADTPWSGDDMIVSALRGPIVLWCAMLGLYLAAEFSPLPTGLALLIQRLLVALLVVSVTWALAQLAGDLIRNRGRRTQNAIVSSPQLVTNLVRVLVLILGGLIVLQELGIAITPLVTALGVTGLAVGLALQDTLANLFAGIYILLSRQVRRGDFIRLSEGQEGVVQDITWRYTTIKQLSNITTIVPNSKLASAVTSNFTLHAGQQAIVIPASVSYEADLQKVEQIAGDVASQVMRDTPGASQDFVPVFRFLSLDDARIRFNVVLAATDREAQYLVRHEFIKRLRARFGAERIA
jgi:small-conductance mechanosensitive channel